MYDALDDSLRKVKKGQHDKKAVLLITDGVDTASYTKLEEARKQLEASLGRPPRAEEMAAKMAVTLEEFEKMAGDATAVSLVSLNGALLSSASTSRLPRRSASTCRPPCSPALTR